MCSHHVPGNDSGVEVHHAVVCDRDPPAQCAVATAAVMHVAEHAGRDGAAPACGLIQSEAEVRVPMVTCAKQSNTFRHLCRRPRGSSFECKHTGMCCCSLAELCWHIPACVDLPVDAADVKAPAPQSSAAVVRQHNHGVVHRLLSNDGPHPLPRLLERPDAVQLTVERLHVLPAFATL